MNRKISEIFGWYGVIAILTAYTLLNFDVFSNRDVWYQMLNLSGALGIVADAVNQKDYPPMVLNLVWALIAIIALVKTIFS